MKITAVEQAWTKYFELSPADEEEEEENEEEEHKNEELDEKSEVDAMPQRRRSQQLNSINGNKHE